MNEIEKIEIIIVKLNDRLTIQEKEFVHLRTKVETNEIKEKLAESNSIKKACIKFTSQTAIHGLLRIQQARSVYSTLIWALLFVVSTCACFYTIGKNTSDYLNYDVITQTKSIKENTAVFPAVVFCAENSYLNLKDTIIYLGYSDIINSDYKETETIKRNIEDNFDIFDVDGKHCLRFNGMSNKETDLKKTNGTEPSKGLVIGFFMPNDLEVVLVFVVDNYLNYLDNSRSFYLFANNFFDVTFTKLIENKLEYPFNKCHKEKSSHTYHQDNCIESCISERIALKYNCTLPGYYQVNQKSTCAEGNGFHQEFQIQCEQVCPEACDKTIYDVAIFTKSMNDKFTSDEKIKKKLLLVSASYSDLNYVAITQIPKSTMFDFISVIGGTVGLYLGMSLFSLAEFFGFIFEIMILFIKDIRQKRVKPENIT